MAYYLGIDGGQSSTMALIGNDDGFVIGSAISGPCNHVSGPGAEERFVSVIRGCLASACLAAGIDANVQFELACCGMSGGAEDKAALLNQILPAKHVVVLTDAQTALSGALAGGVGVVVISGTGSIALGRDDSGTFARAGGWGYVFGDDGSAFDIARHAIRAVLRHEEGWGPATSLRPALLAATLTKSANELLHACYRPEWPRSRVATLAALVDSSANDGDPIARGILEQAAQSLASLATSVRAQLFHKLEAVRIAFAGGVFRSRLLLERFRLLVELADFDRAAEPIYGPAAGALFEAYRASGLSVVLSGVPVLK